MDDEDIVAIINALGYRPIESLQFDNFCGSDHEGHRQLARFAASLATEYGGIVDVGGAEPLGGAGETAADIHRLETGGYLLSAEAYADWCEHPLFYLEK